MTIDLYYAAVSPPCRVVLLAAKAIDIELNLIPLDLLNGEHLSPAFLKLNPQHTIPTLNDNGFVIWESRAIITYLQNQYGKNDSLYPKDSKKRAVVDQRLYFDMDLNHTAHEVYNQKTMRGSPIDPEKVENLNKSLGILDAFLENSEYVTGDNLTLADLSLVVQISNLVVLKHNLTAFKNINRWYANIEATFPGYHEANNLSLLKSFIEKISKAQ